MKCKYPDEVCASMTVLNGVAYCDSVPCVLRDEIPPMTNADRIRSMSDEELAAIMYSFEDLKMPDYCQRKKECDDMLDANIDIPDEKCRGCLVDWLRQPCQEGAEQK